MKPRHPAPIILILTLCLCAATAASPATAAYAAGSHSRAAVVDDLSGTVRATQNETEFPAFRGLALLRDDEINTEAES